MLDDTSSLEAHGWLQCLPDAWITRDDDSGSARTNDGRLPAGARVPDSVIAKQMGISRAPVRDACALLVQSGLLTKRPHHAYQVRTFSEHNLGDYQLIRRGYE
ncbi:GntR family transcriptional regulator [Curtobacterium sp. AB7]|uniref:GntR family transcriptional regulator n=1 Tax=Curtobacterium sp. AB7 TaxID=3349327 RepID=UPI003834F131